jgi:Glycosyl hydrolase family 26
MEARRRVIDRTAPPAARALNKESCSTDRGGRLSGAPPPGVLDGVRRAACLALLLPALLASPPAEARTFGVYVDPWHVGEWARDIGVAPQYVGRFEAFSRGTTVDSFLREAERQGLRRVLVSWEPWRPVPPQLGIRRQFRPQPGYRNRDIARGAQDAYILRFALSLATFRGRVDLRYAHEMNGTWYPWSHDPVAYRRAWRHIVRLFRRAGVRNVRFVWSPNPSLFLPFRPWLRSVRVYWPGRRYVDAVGSTMINFGGEKRYAVRRFRPRLRALHRRFRKPVMLTEVNTRYGGRVRWLRDLRRLLRRTRWIRSVAWFQHRSRGAVQIRRAGRLDWDVRRDPAAAAVLRGIIRDGRQAPGRPRRRQAGTPPPRSRP